MLSFRVLQASLLSLGISRGVGAKTIATFATVTIVLAPGADVSFIALIFANNFPFSAEVVGGRHLVFGFLF